MPAQSPYQKPFRIFAGVAITLLLIILSIAIWTPMGLSDETTHIIGWGAGAIVVAAVMVAYWLAIKEGSWKLKKAYRVEVSDGKIIQRRPGSPTIEILVDQIASLHQSRGGWLIIRGDEPEKRVAVPSEIVGFENLKQELSANRTVSPLRVKTSPWLFLPPGSFVLACILLFVSHGRDGCGWCCAFIGRTLDVLVGTNVGTNDALQSEGACHRVDIHPDLPDPCMDRV